MTAVPEDTKAEPPAEHKNEDIISLSKWQGIGT